MPETGGKIPEKIGKYEVRRELGRGGSGVVYIGYDPFEDQEVAVKVYFTDQEVGERQAAMQRQAFFNEAHIAGKLNHPSILSITDAGEEGEHRYIVMEYFPEAHPLSVYTKPSNLLPLRKTVEIIFAVSRALDYAHRNGVVHRDVKPANLMMNIHGDVKIVDFGTALTTKLESTDVLGVVGTPRYMSPEHIQDEGVGPQADIFSLGVVAYELLAGVPAFSGSNLQALMNQILNEDPAPLDNFRHDLPKGLVDVIHGCLRKSKDERYKTGMDVAADLARVYSELTVQAEEIAEKERYSMVRKLDFFREFDQLQIWEIIRASQWNNYNAGDEIIVEGEMDDSFFIIVFGSVSVYKGGQRLGLLETGDCFGEMGYLSKHRRTATIKAEGNVNLMKVSATLIEQVSKDCQLNFYKTFVKTLIDRLASTSEKLLAAQL